MKLELSQLEEATILYKDGVPLKKLAEKYGVSQPSMSKYIRSAGVPLRKRGRRPAVVTQPVITPAE